MTILESIKNLLVFKGSATISEIAKASGKKYPEALLCLTKNRNLIIVKKTKVVGFKDVVAVQKSEAYDKGLSYKEIAINYGVQFTYETNNPFGETLKEHYICGWLGDSYTVNVILATPKNKELLEANGIVNYNDVEVKQIEELWNE